MSRSRWSEENQTIGNMSFTQVVAKLREMGDEEAATDLETARNNFYSQKGTLSFLMPKEDHQWVQYGNKYWASSHYEFGYLAPSELTNKSLEIVHACSATSDTNLQNTSVAIPLDRFHVADYPGRSPYRILLRFSTQPQRIRIGMFYDRIHTEYDMTR